MVRDLVSMVAAATERCCVWPKTAAQDVKCTIPSQSKNGRPERGLLSMEVLPSLNRRNLSTTGVQPIAPSPYVCCNN